MKKDMFGKGFTLIELLVVVLIIGILAAVALPQYQKAMVKAQLTQIRVLLDTVDKAQHVYFLANGQYATNLSSLDIEIPSGGNIEGNIIDYPGQFYCHGATGGRGLQCFLPSNHPYHYLGLERRYTPLADLNNAKTLCWASGTYDEKIHAMCRLLGGIQNANNSALYILD